MVKSSYFIVFVSLLCLSASAFGTDYVFDSNEGFSGVQGANGWSYAASFTLLKASITAFFVKMPTISLRYSSEARISLMGRAS